MAKQQEKTTVHDVAIELLQASKTNPRKYFSDEGLEDLTASIKDKGIMQPLLVRKAEDGYEIIAGERRYRAAKAAGIKLIPVRVMDLTDQQVIEVQVVENMQRVDLSPMEEAQGYKTLHEQYKYDWDELAAKIGKSKGYIYSRIKFLNLIPEFQKLLSDGKIKITIAEQIIRIQNLEDQEKLLKAMDTEAWQFIDHGTNAGDRHVNIGDDMSAKATAKYIEENFLLQLKDAKFSVKDETFTGGACLVCVKRTGANPDLFNETDTKKDSCLDVDCWKNKIKENDDRIKSKFSKYVEEGKKVLTGEKAEKVLAGEAYKKLTDTGRVGYYEKLKNSKMTWAEAIAGTEYVPVIVVDSKGKGHEMVKVSDALKVIPKSRQSSENSNTQSLSPEDKAKEELKKAKKELEKKATSMAAEEIIKKIVDATPTKDFNHIDFLRQFAHETCNNDTVDKLANTFLGVKISYSTRKKVTNNLKQKQLKQIIVLAMLESPSDWEGAVREEFVEQLETYSLAKEFEQLRKEKINEMNKVLKSEKKGGTTSAKHDEGKDKDNIDD